jgi:hypothetical protein
MIGSAPAPVGFVLDHRVATNSKIDMTPVTVNLSHD